MPFPQPQIDVLAPPSQGGRSTRAWLVAASVTIAATAVASVVGIATLSHADRALAATSVLVSDAMQRSVSEGLGSAPIGGRYVVSPAALSRVSAGAAELGPLGPGKGVSARLASVVTRDVTAAMTVVVPRRSAGGSGVYTYLQLRRQVTGDTYAVMLRIDGGDRLSVMLTRIRNGVESTLGRPAPAFTARPGSVVTIAGQAWGTAVVQLRAAAWPGNIHSAGARRWQMSATDAGGHRISAGGAIGIAAYQSARAVGSVIVPIRELQATRWSGAATDSTLDHVLALPGREVRTSAQYGIDGVHLSAPSVSAPTTGADAGSAAPGSSAYPVPAGAIFVSPSGSDSASGSAAAPFRTLHHAVSAAPAGATIVMRAGVYHESVTVPANKPLTIQSFPHEAVWLDGTRAVTSWRESGDTWIHSGWTTRFDDTPSYTSGQVSDQPDFQFLNPAYPLAAHPEQVWIGGTSLTQVGSRAAVGPGTFYVDQADDELVVGSDPQGQARASDLGIALTSYAPGFTLRGIGVRRYATAVDQIGTIRLAGSGDAVENVISEDNSTTGLTLDKHNNMRVSHVTVTRNGMLGMHANLVDGLSVVGLLATANNTRHFNLAPVSGGMKVTSSSSVRVMNSTFSGNDGVGAWFDEGTFGLDLTGCNLTNNAGHGLSFEISSTGVIADNVVTGNGEDGLKINDTDHVAIWDNTVADNGRDVELVQDLRRGDTPTQPEVLSHIAVMNNVFGTAAAGSYQLYARDFSGEYTAAGMHLTIDGNLFAPQPSGAAVVWGIAHNAVAVYHSARSFAAATRQGSANTDSSATTFAAVGSSSGRPLPPAIATLIGKTAGTRHVGAF